MALTGAPSCLAGCVADYYCKPLEVPGPAGQQAESFAPFVKVTIGDGVNEITVGNESYQTNPNTAIIKSFEIGWIDSHATVVEVVDEAGGRFGMIVDSIHKCLKNGWTQATSIKSQFGWVYRTCENQMNIISSPSINSTITNLEINYSEGKIKYKLTGNTIAEPIYEERREDENLGVEGKPMKLEDAIRELCAKPPTVNVQFCWREADGKWKCGSHTWKGFPKGGPKATWQSDNMNKVATITKWLEPFRVDDGTQKGKGIVVLNDSLMPDKLYIVKDLTLEPGESIQACTENNTLGTFIVNGGKCSPVISFNPTINWIRGAANFSAGGGTNGPGSSRSRFEEDEKTPQQEKTHGSGGGLQQQLTTTQQAWQSYGPKNAWLETMKSHQAHAKAGRLTEVGVEPIQADLIILGDPRIQFCDITKWQGKHVAIVAINPFHITQAESSCGEWLAMPGCNEILSNKAWMVTGINHSIKEGSYTTTLKVTLNVQGVNIGIKDPLGGVGSGGPSVKNNCGG